MYIDHMEQNSTPKEELPCQYPQIKLYTLDEKQAKFVYNWHKDLEIIFIEAGKLTIQTEGKTYDLGRKDSLVIDIGSIHTITSRHPFKAIILKIPQAHLKTIIPEIDNLSFSKPATDQIKKQIADILEHLEYCTAHNKNGNQILFNIYLYELIYICYKQCTVTLKKSTNKLKLAGRSKLQKAIDYINAHYVEKIDLNTLASMIGVQTNYFCRLFKKCYGITPLEYIYSLRFSKISQELINTTMPIGTIMKNSGFSNWKVFSQLFKQRFSITASTFRKKYQIQTDRIEDEMQDNQNH